MLSSDLLESLPSIFRRYGHAIRPIFAEKKRGGGRGQKDGRMNRSKTCHNKESRHVIIRTGFDRANMSEIHHVI